MTLTLDLETKSFADLPRVGVWNYSLDPTTDIICLCYGIGSEPIQHWWPDKEGVDLVHNTPRDFYMHVMTGGLLEAHNAAFELALYKNVLMRKYGWVEVLDHQWRDSMAVAAYYSLPMALDKLARALKFEPKDSEGTRLISRYSKLFLKTAKQDIPPEDFAKFRAYCEHDVKMEMTISDWLGDLPERELPVFQLDLAINQRGLHLDQTGIDHAVAVVEMREQDYTEEFRRITNLNPTQRDKVMGWFAENGLPLENMQAEYLEELLEDGDVPQGPCRRALELRLGTAKASTKKLDAMSRQRGSDGRARFQCRYHGASTGRWTGTGFQPLNLKKGFEDVDPAQLVRDISYRNPKYLDMLYGDATAAVANASRHWIQAQPGNKIIAGDFVSIEAVVLACLAGEDWKVQAFRDGAKIYEMMGEKIHKLPPGTVTKATHPAERQDGKTGELAFGYQGALNAWLKFDNSGRHSDERIIEICKAWRTEHPAITRFWRELEQAAIEAVIYRGRETGYGEIGFQVVDEWLSMILPNGKRIWYFDPQLREQMPRWHDPEVNEDCAAGACKCRPKPCLSYMAQKTGQWKRVYTYGGKLTENACQAVSREILVPSMLALEDAGYPVVLSIYDEIVAEMPEDFGSVEEFIEISLNPKGRWWPESWPIRMEAWAGKFYKK